MVLAAEHSRRETIVSMVRIAAALVLFTLLPHTLFAPPAISIKITGFWRPDIGVNELTGGAGSDFPAFFESAVDQIDITITKTVAETYPWRLDVKRADVNWHANLSLYVQRTPGGTGDTGAGASVTGGTTYQLIGTSDQTLCTGTGDWSKLPFQYRIEGMSAFVPADTYETTVYYTVTET